MTPNMLAGMTVDTFAVMLASIEPVPAIAVAHAGLENDQTLVILVHSLVALHAIVMRENTINQGQIVKKSRRRQP